MVTPAQWQQLVLAGKQQGLSPLIVQWSQYGADDFLREDTPLRRLLQASEADAVPLWLGLYADPGAFSQAMPPEQRRQYVQGQLAHNALLLSRLLLSLPVADTRLAGWYLPLELYDVDLQTDDAAQWLKQQLAAFVSAAGRPVAVSVFSNGSLDAETFAARLASLRQDGLVLWLQDGSGAALLPAQQRQRLLAKLDCGIGVIVEAFRQPQYAAAFSAIPASQAELSAALADLRPCHALAYFSLRYLSVSQQILPLSDN